MSFKLIWITVLMLFCSAHARLTRSAQKEMILIQDSQTDMNSINWNEHYPFARTISEVDPFVLELKKLAQLKEEI